MHVRLDGVEKGRERIRFLLDGEVVEAHEGDSIASAMIAAGKIVFRKSHSESDRGMYCGMGVCGECQILIGTESKRACMEKVSEGLAVTRHPSRRILQVDRTAPAASIGDWLEISTDVLIVGAGPGGLSAAIAAARYGLQVLVVDERALPGGQYFKQPSLEFEIHEEQLDRQFLQGRQLIRQAEELGVRIRSGTAVWGTFENSKVAASSKDETLLIAAKRIVLSPGAYERPVPFPGWTLPGVTTTGAAQTLLRAYKTVPGKRVLVAGNGPLNIQVAEELSKAGANVVAVVESAKSPFASPVAGLRMMFSDFRLTCAGIGQLAMLRAKGIPLHFRHVLFGADGTDRVHTASIARMDDDGRILAGTEKHFSVDSVCINSGFFPQSELARSLGCEYDFDHTTGTVIARRTQDGRTDAEHVFVIGDASEFGGARVAACQGAIAGYTIARDLDPGSVNDRVLARLRSQLMRHRRFQRALWRMYRAPHFSAELARPDTIICRCEDLDLQTIERHFSDGSRSLASLKKASRAGMGRCQGRYCSSLLASMCSRSGSTSHDSDFFAPRPPFKPTPLRTIAGSCGQAIQPSDLLNTNSNSANILP
ncbi:MAG: FAD-dependent oxidoreductase [Gammaproteobacteria bacterium]|nr:FAD-dependent oxidoreductase [Gammaproteobacteria bacterium]MDH4315983.1 FAD-dependent oxidoreductase [Gammaproteobacteria bacterium]MDH5214449.1 FAD-dependent oxidoreductase [Gammaproteobacteria bacterium]